MLRSLRLNLKSVGFHHVSLDALVLTFSLYFSLYLRVGWLDFPQHLAYVHWFIPIVVGTKLLVFMLSGVYNIFWRYVSAIDALKISRSVLLSSAIIITISFFISDEMGRLPRTVYLIDTFISLMGVMSVRLLKRLMTERKYGKQIRAGKKTLIYGAGDLGRILATHFRSDPGQGIHLVGFVDDDPKKEGHAIGGTLVLGSGDDLAMLIEKYEVSQVIIASSKMPSEKVRRVIECTRTFNIRPKIVSNTRLLEQDQQKFVAIEREINLTDLLNRKPRHVDISSVREMIRGKRVLVTGAGGSIGSEISRQVLDHDPARLLLLDHSELSLYEIDKELRLSTSDTSRVVPLLMDLKDFETLDVCLNEYKPQVIIHAAAYKHVHLVESNPHPSILNNIASTKNLLDLSKNLDIDAFILVSTDKAVNPAGVMGATKRVCEMLVSLSGIQTRKNYCSVRFGNVLGSSGSLIPLLKNQIREGGPVTVTHQDMTRYFMLIPEAVSLVLKAATVSASGDISVLKMGEPVKILDIAKSMIALSGKTEDEVPIIFTGLRPGEKLYEELYLRGNEIKTEHPDILTIPKGDLGVEDFANDPLYLDQKVTEMIELAKKGDRKALHILNELVQSTYEPPEQVRKESEQITFLINNKNRVH
jgi:FlaA1/EpsC-like NDP-sugar epimerase